MEGPNLCLQETVFPKGGFCSLALGHPGDCDALARTTTNQAETYTTEIKPLDPWQHRSAHMKCRTCMWFVPKQIANSDQPVLGRCRRHSPTLNGYPAVYENDWCGDHKLDETKL
jgi:hypothetical protein